MSDKLKVKQVYEASDGKSFDDINTATLHQKNIDDNENISKAELFHRAVEVCGGDAESEYLEWKRRFQWDVNVSDEARYLVLVDPYSWVEDETLRYRFYNDLESLAGVIHTYISDGFDRANVQDEIFIYDLRSIDWEPCLEYDFEIVSIVLKVKNREIHFTP